jgi:uncharacterized protein YyaL (SSP411 family)
MAEGGLFDQLGGGFCRYSVDERWEIPHFEKMLYDNAQLLALYAASALATGEGCSPTPRSAPPTGCCASCASGRGRRWRAIFEPGCGLGRPRRPLLCLAARAGATGAHGRGVRAYSRRTSASTGRRISRAAWHLCVRESVDAIAATQQLSADAVRAAAVRRTAKLLQLRAQRVRPGLDDKVLASWNALGDRGASLTAARCLKREDYADAATAALQFLRRVHWQGGRLLATSARGEARLAPIWMTMRFCWTAILELAGVRFAAPSIWPGRSSWPSSCCGTSKIAAVGGFFFTADDHEALISRPKSFSDEAIPAGNAIAARALLRLGYLLGEPRYLAAAERTLRAAWPALQQVPGKTCLDAAGARGLPESATDRDPARHRCGDAAVAARTQRGVCAAPLDARGARRCLRPAAGTRLQARRRRPLAYLCRGSQCSAPLRSLSALLGELAGHGELPRV